MENKKPYSIARIIFNNSCEETEIRLDNELVHRLFMDQVLAQSSYIIWDYGIKQKLIIYKSAIREIRISRID